MPDYSDLRLTYTAPEKTAVLSFDSGRQSLVLQVTPVPSGPTGAVVATAEQLTEAVKTPGSYVVSKGTYVGNWVISASGVTIACQDGVTLTANEGSLPILKVTGSQVTWRGGTCQAGYNEGVIVGSHLATTAEAQPTDVVFEDVSVAADPVKGGSRGFALHSRAVTLTRVRVLNYFRKGQEVQGILILNGPGPYTVTDSYIEGAGENLMSGGGSVLIPGCVPSDITVTGCTFYKPDRWRTDGSTVKNLFELKHARRVLVERCVFDGNWKAAQAGHAIVFTVRNSDGKMPWVTVDDVVFRHNIVRHSSDGYGVNILGHEDGGRVSEQTKRITLEDNLFEHCTGGVCVNSGVTELLSISRNTFPAITGSILIFANCGTKTDLEMTDNVSMSGIYGLFASCTGASKGEPALKTACDPYLFVRNVIEKTLYKNSAGQMVAASIPWPSGNTILAPTGLTYGPQFTYDADGDGKVDAGWPGSAGLPAQPAVAAREAAPAAVIEEDDVAAAQSEALVLEDDRPVVLEGV